MPFARSLLIVGLLALAGCTQTTSGAGTVRLSLSALPGNLATPCRDPGVRAEQAALRELLRNRQALAECKRKHRDVVRYYDQYRRQLAGKK